LTKIVLGIAERHAQGRVVSALEGGYELGALSRSVAAHLRALTGCCESRSTRPRAPTG
jgi:acetoin utilization deacetylase AcuC-like enzyme